MYSWLHFSLATVCALIAGYSLYRAPARQAEPAAVAADVPAD
jgi:alpha-1,6-mannosyltransferase